MAEYVVGSVADFISTGKIPKKQTKKRKFDINNGNESQVTDAFCDSNNVKSSNVISSRNNSFVPPSEKKAKTGTSLKKNTEESDKTEIQSKKRKKSWEFNQNSEADEKYIYDKQNIDLLPLNNIPSDSEEEEEIELKKNDKKNKDIKSKEKFTKENNENTIFIGNIPINFDKQKVCKVFSKFGEIQNARIRCVPVENLNMTKKVAAIKKKFNPKRKSFVAYVKYKSQESANAALKANGMVLEGHHIRVDLAEQNKERDNNKAVFVGGLPFDIEDEELWDFFQNCGEINSVRVIRDAQTSLGKGFGYVNFVSSASVELALQLNGQVLKKRTINVKRCVKARNKNKLNSFGKKKSNELATQLLNKKGKKYKEEKKKLKKENNEVSFNFQGKMADKKKKKKKKLSQAALRQRKMVKILGASK